MRTVLALLVSGMLLFSAQLEAKIIRSQSAKNAFKRNNPCPANGARAGPCKGYVVDHIKPLCAGGADNPGNMQWQTVKDAAKKDRRERVLCRHKKPTNR